MSANERQVGGDHYQRVPGEQHWDRLVRLYGWPRAKVYWIGNITAYVERHEEKGGIQDLKKALHYLEKMIENEEKYLDEQDRLKAAILEKNPGLAPLFSDEAIGPGGESTGTPGDSPNWCNSGEELKGDLGAGDVSAEGVATSPPPSKAVCVDCGEYYPMDDLLKEGWVYCKFCRLKDGNKYQRQVQPITMTPGPSWGNPAAASKVFPDLPRECTDPKEYD